MEIKILVEDRYRSVFNNIVEESKIVIAKEERLSSIKGYWVTLLIEDCEDAYWLGRNFQIAILKFSN